MVTRQAKEINKRPARKQCTFKQAQTSKDFTISYCGQLRGARGQAPEKGVGGHSQAFCPQRCRAGMDQSTSDHLQQKPLRSVWKD